MSLEEKIAAIIDKVFIDNLIVHCYNWEAYQFKDLEEELAKEIMKIIEEHCEERDGDSIHCSWCGAWQRLVPKEEMMFRGTKE
jgi:hypothetical protein